MEKYKVYSDDPVAVAKSFEDMGIKRLHIVDLDGARSGALANFNVIEEIVKDTHLSIDVGGGIRDIDRCDVYFDLGVDFVTIGTIVIKDMKTTKDILLKYPEKVILGLDAKDGYVATDGWYEKSTKTAKDVIEEYRNFEAAAVIYTDISRDGMLTGIKYKSHRRACKIFSFSCNSLRWPI